jgi:hypothetical protein
MGEEVVGAKLLGNPLVLGKLLAVIGRQRMNKGVPYCLQSWCCSRVRSNHPIRLGFTLCRSLKKSTRVRVSRECETQEDISPNKPKLHLSGFSPALIL